MMLTELTWMLILQLMHTEIAKFLFGCNNAILIMSESSLPVFKIIRNSFLNPFSHYKF